MSKKKYANHVESKSNFESENVMERDKKKQTSNREIGTNQKRFRKVIDEKNRGEKRRAVNVIFFFSLFHYFK